MANNQLQTVGNFGVQDWQAVYNAFNNPNLASYDFETLRQAMIQYLQKNNPENFNDYITSSEFVSLIDLIAFMGQAMSYRFDLNARENFLATAKTVNSVNYLANLVNYVPSRNLAANGLLKLFSVNINEDIYDSLGNNLNGLTISWNDPGNRNWLDQWNSVINAVLISSQTIGNPGNSQSINNITYSEYGVSSVPGQTSPYAFNAVVNNTNMNFEAVDVSSIGQSYLYEVDPNTAKSAFNLLLGNDGNGYGSINTGFFTYFKQGTLQNQSISITQPIPYYTITLNATGINNTDLWLYQVNSDGSLTQWTQVPSIYGENVQYNGIANSVQNIFSVSNGTNDTVTLNFGDGIFGAIPNGNFICYTRSSNGLTYRINPNEMSNIVLSIPYLSKTGRTQTLTAQASLQYTIGNSSGAQSIADIKTKAPQNYYTQNRMVNGQDYNSLPFTQYNNILQIKAVNRTSSGVSRYLDVVDPTGKYSTTNIFCDDGFIYLDPSIQINNYTYNSKTDLATLLESQVANIISSNGSLSFVYNNYPINYLSYYNLNGESISGYTGLGPNIQWNMALTDNTSCSGWLGNIATIASSFNTVVSINDASFDINGNTSVLTPGAILEFIAPPFYAFDNNNNLITNSSNSFSTSPLLGVNQKTKIYTTIVGTPENYGYGNGIDMSGVNIDGSGAIQLNQKVPSGALLSAIYPYYQPTLPASVIQQLITYISASLPVALQYRPDYINSGQSLWQVITNFPANFSLSAFGSTFYPPTNVNATNTNSWMLAFIPTAGVTNGVTVYNQNNAYYFGSQKQTSFYFDTNAKIYNPENGTTLTDRITILSTNPAPGTNVNVGLPLDIPVDIAGTVNEINGSTDSNRVQIQYADLTSTGFASNPNFFVECVGSFSSTPSISNTYVFFVTDNSASTTTILPASPNPVVVVSTPTVINNNLYTYANGTIVFSISNTAFYQIIRNGSIASKVTLNNPGDTLTYSYFVGRQGLKFQYQHNAADNRRIDPSPANIIDMYCLEASYASAYQQWITDTTGQVSEPSAPTTETLSNDFALLNNYKMLSDELVFNSAQFVPLFGDKADPSVQATFVVVPIANLPVSSGEIASQLITAVNNYFAIGNFKFGQTFYWSLLNSYLISQLAGLVSSINLVPTSGNMGYGSLEQITCNPYEIFISAATVNNVKIVTNLNNLTLKIGQSY